MARKLSEEEERVPHCSTMDKNKVLGVKSWTSGVVVKMEM